MKLLLPVPEAAAPLSALFPATVRVIIPLVGHRADEHRVVRAVGH